MNTITLESIKAEHSKLAEMIAAFEKQQEAPEFYFPEATINLASGEHYAGIIVGKDGEPSYHLILLPGQADSITWSDAKAWANGQNGELPTRREQSLLFANLKEQFDPNCYWSAENHEQDSAAAWFQYFLLGDQLTRRKSFRCRARAVRRLVLE